VDKLHIACVATKEEGYFNAYLDSLSLYGYDSTDVHLLGWQQPWLGFGYKLTLFKEFLESLPCDDIVVLTDAYDVLCTATKEQCLERYRQFNSPVVLSVNATPSIPVVGGLYQLIFPKFRGKNLNTGLWMGEVAALLDLITRAQPFVVRYNDDQLAIIKAIQGHHSIQAALDVESQLFRNVAAFEHLSREQLLSGCFVHGWYNTDLTEVVQVLFGSERCNQYQPTEHYFSRQRLQHYTALFFKLQRERLQLASTSD